MATMRQLLLSRVALRLALAAGAAASISGCSDATRLASDPFSDPFGGSTKVARAGRPVDNVSTGSIPGASPAPVQSQSLAAPGAAIKDRVQGITEGVHESLPTLQLASLDTGGQSVRADGLLTKFLQTQRGQRLLIATLDDLAAVYAARAIEMNRRQSDCIIVSQGLDPNIHGGTSEKKELDPNNRGSVVLGSVAYYMDRYGYDVLPLALRLVAGETLPPRTATQHVLVTAANVFREYPPFDMN